MNTARLPLRSEILTTVPPEDARRWQGPDFFPSAPPEPEAEASTLPQAPPVPAGPTVAELEAIEAQAREAGYQAGLAQAREAAAAELDQHRGHLERLFNALARPLESVDRQVEAAVAELALHVARQVVYRAIEERPEHLLDTIRAALAALPLGSRGIVLRLHPDDAELVARQPGGEAATDSWRIQPDPTLQRGDLLVDTEMSHVDARVETRLKQMKDTVQAGAGPQSDD